MEPERILITGGCGFIGSNLCSMLLDSGNDIVCVDNLDSFYNPERKFQNVKSCFASNRFILEKTDITDRTSLNEVIKKYKPDLVIHLASKVNVLLSLKYPEAYHQTNVIGTRNLLDAMRANNVNKLVFASSSSVYGESSKEYFSEMDELKPVSPYGASKARAEDLILEYAGKGEMSAVVLRLFNVYGKGLRPDLFIHKLFLAATKGELVSVFNQGKNRKDYTYIADTLDGLRGGMQFLRNSCESCSVFNIGSGISYSNEEILNFTEEIFNQELNINYTDAIKGDISFTRANIAHARELINYNPNTNIRQGLELTYKYLQNEKD